jgi:hypothetical protein
VFSAVAEIGTGFALVLDPAIVVALLLGVDAAGVAIVAGPYALMYSCRPPSHRSR